MTITLDLVTGLALGGTAGLLIGLAWATLWTMRRDPHELAPRDPAEARAIAEAVQGLGPQQRSYRVRVMTLPHADGTGSSCSFHAIDAHDIAGVLAGLPRRLAALHTAHDSAVISIKRAEETADA